MPYDVNRKHGIYWVYICALNSIMSLPTCGANCLDRIYVNDSNYAVKVTTSMVRSDHKAITAYSGALPQLLHKSCHRRHSPSVCFKPYIPLL